MFTLPENVFRRGNDAPEAMVARYKPRTFDELLGQPLVVRRLKRYVARPYSCAKLLHSPGTGSWQVELYARLILAKELLSDSGWRMANSADSLKWALTERRETFSRLVTPALFATSGEAIAEDKL